MGILELFQKCTKQNGVFNIQSIDNIPSIMQSGLLSKHIAEEYDHVSIAMPEIQARRDTVIVPNGMGLHYYASLYFDPRNPMLSKRRNQNEEICILKVDASVLEREGVVVSDRNASSGYASFYPPEEGLREIDFNLVYAEDWNDSNYYEYWKKKSIKCAEVLVPDIVPYEYIVCAAVYNDAARRKMLALGFDRKIFVKPGLFF